MSSESSTRSPSFQVRSTLAHVPEVRVASMGLPLTVTLVLLPAHAGMRRAMVKRSGCERMRSMLVSPLAGYWVCWVSETRALPCRQLGLGISAGHGHAPATLEQALIDRGDFGRHAGG